MSNWLRPLLVLKCDLFKMYPERPLARTAIQPTFFQRRWDFYGDEVSDFSYLLGSFQWGASWGIQTFSGTTPGRSNLSVLILVSSSLGIRNSEIHKLSISSTSRTYLEPSVRLNAAPCRQLLTSVPMGKEGVALDPKLFHDALLLIAWVSDQYRKKSHPLDPSWYDWVICTFP